MTRRRSLSRARLPVHAHPTLQEEWREFIRSYGTNGVLRTDRRELVLPGLVEAFEPEGMQLSIASDLPFTAVLRDDGTMEASLTATIYPLSGDTGLVGLVGRTLDTRVGVVNLDALLLEPAARGQNIATRMMRRSVSLYDQVGIDRIDVKARMLGRYAWTRFGFRFDDEAVAEGLYWQMFSTYGRLKAHMGWSEPFPTVEELTEPWAYALLNFDRYENPRTITREQVADALSTERFRFTNAVLAEMPPEMPVSMALLAYGPAGDWDGYLPLEPSGRPREILDGYLARKLD